MSQTSLGSSSSSTSSGTHNHMTTGTTTTTTTGPTIIALQSAVILTSTEPHHQEESCEVVYCPPPVVVEDNDVTHNNPYAIVEQDNDLASVNSLEEEQQQQQQMLLLFQTPPPPQPQQQIEREISQRTNNSSNNTPQLQPRSVLQAGIESIKFILSSLFFMFSLVFIITSIFHNDLNIWYNVLFLALCILLLLALAILEGGQGALLGLLPVPTHLYQHTHPQVHRPLQLMRDDDNHNNHNHTRSEAFIVGRQFLVVLVVFLLNYIINHTNNNDNNTTWWNDHLPSTWIQILRDSGVPLVFVTITLGQLTFQINASSCMLDFVQHNHRILRYMVRLSYACEQSGILHAVYFIQSLLQTSNTRTTRTLSYNLKVAFSILLLAFSMAVTMAIILTNDNNNSIVSIFLFFLLLSIVGLLEGMQIAIFKLCQLPPDDDLACRQALDLARPHLPALMIGRQICVTLCTFVLANVTASNNQDDGLFWQTLLGLFGALVTTTILGSLIWRIVASTYPVAFLRNPVVYFMIRLSLLVEQSGVCSVSWILARYHRMMYQYQLDEVYYYNENNDTTTTMVGLQTARRDKDIDRLLVVGKYTYSLALLGFSVVAVSVSIFQETTMATNSGGIPAIVAFLVLWILIVWLAMMEGGQGALVGLQPVDPAAYAATHPRTLRCTQLAHKGDNLDRFIVGRQFLVVLVVFAIHFVATTTTTTSSSSNNVPQLWYDIFVSTGLGAILMTIIIGQLMAQVNAATCMLDFVNNYAMLVTTYISLFIEWSGLLHSVYLVQRVFGKVSGSEIQSKEPQKSWAEQALFWIRVAGSLALLGLALAVTLTALFQGKTQMWDGVPDYASVIIFFVLVAFVGMMEGMQIALFSVVNLPEDKLEHHPVAQKNAQLAFRDQNLPAFLIGRQICVTIFMFVMARITTVDVNLDSGGGDEEEETIFGVSQGLQRFFNTGLLGAIITTIVASLSWRIIASSFPLSFLSNPLVNPIIHLCMIVEASGVCSSAWVLGRWNKLLVGFQPDTVYLKGADRHGKKPVTKRDKDVDVTITVLKYLYSSALLIFSITVVMAAMFTEQTNVSEIAHPAIAFFVFWGLLAWLALMEGGQGCLVGLQPVEPELYRKSHPATFKNTSIAHRGDNMARFIIGRQFLVVLVVFVVNLCGSAVAGASVLNLSDGMTEVFLASGVALILTTIIAGQLAAQINAANCMLDFVNTYFMTVTIWISLAIEKSGLLHSVYLVQMIFEKMSGTSDEGEPPRSLTERILFWFRVMVSLAVLGFAFAVTLAALFSGQTAMWDGVPETVSVIVFFVLMCFVGMMEGMQIALFAVINLPEEELKQHSTAHKNCTLIFGDNNFQAFLVGRQICVTICTFVIARITTVNVDTSIGEDTIFGVGDGMQEFFNTGLLGAVITTVIASLAWRIIGSSFPVAFMSNPLIYVIIRICLALERSGVCAAAWLLARIHKQVARFRTDDEYIGTLEERAAAATAAKNEDHDDEEVEVGAAVATKEEPSSLQTASS